MPTDEPALVIHWERTLGDLLDRTRGFPKAARFTFTTRIDNRALDIFEKLVQARFAPVAERQRLLASADTDLAVLRALLRLSHARRYLDRRGLEHLSRLMDEAGRMLGGWRRHLSERT